MKTYDVIIIGGGPSGLCAAQRCAEAGLDTLLLDRSPSLGGQLIKQTHKFFGSKEHYAKVRGIDIAKLLQEKLTSFENLTIYTETTVVGIYEDFVVSTLHHNQYKKVQAKAILCAVGASEKFLALENNDLPQIIGAGALQTLVNQTHVVPGDTMVMIGSGNIGLIVSYQMMQAGMKVKAIIEANNCIGGYKVHASKLRRLGVPIHTKSTIKKAIGTDKLEAVEIIQLDEHYQEIPNTSQIIPTDVLCISVGLSPLHQLTSMLNAKSAYIQELGGWVPLLDDTYQSSVPGLFACGDMVGIEEASSAMMEGHLAALHVCAYLKQSHPQEAELIPYYENQLYELRNGVHGAKTLKGILKRKEAMNAQ